MSDAGSLGFFARIRKHKVVQWAIAYLSMALVLVQVADSVGSSFGITPPIMRGLYVLTAVGLFAVIIVAWYHGARGAQQVTSMEILMLTALMLIAGGILTLVKEDRAVAAASVVAGTSASQPPVPIVGGLAVMPFDDFSGQPSRLSDAIHDEILTHLAQIPGLNPISRLSVVSVARAQKTVREIADTFNVRYVVEGSIQAGNERLNVNVQLNDGQTERQVWSDSHVFDFADPFTLREEVAQWVTEKLLAAVPEARAPEGHSGATISAAYDAYLNGRILANSRKREDLARAIAELERSVELDPTFAPAQASLALAYGLWGTYGYGGPYASYDTYGRALRLADQALQLDHRMADGYSVVAHLMSKAFGPADTVAGAFREALSRAPSSADAQILYASFLARESRFEESLAASELAIRLDPVAPGRDSGFGYNALTAGMPEIALRAAERASQLEADLMAPRVIRALALVLLNRAPECLEIDLGPQAAVRAICLHAVGETKLAAALIDSVQADPAPGLPGQHVATYYAWTGNTARALAALERTFDEGPSGLDFRIVQSPLFERVRQDPAFQRGWDRLRREVWSRVQRARRDVAVS